MTNAHSPYEGMKKVSTTLTHNHTARRDAGDIGSKHGIRIVWTVQNSEEETAQARHPRDFVNIGWLLISITKP